MSSQEHERTNPFDDENGSFLVLRNKDGAHSLWPAHLVVPTGWETLGGPDGRQSCLDRIEDLWGDKLRPKAPRAA